MGSLHNIDFGVFWASTVPGRNWVPGTGSVFDGSDRFCVSKVPGSVSWKPGSGPRFRVQKVVCPRVRRFRCSMGSDVLGSVPEVWTEPGSGNRVPETRGIKKVPGSGDSIPKVPKVTFYFACMLLYFESIITM